jgi:hypothetical protein
LVVFSEIAFGMDDGGVTAGDVVGDEINKDAEVLFFGTAEESFELVEPLGGIEGVVGADIVVVADGVGAAGDALEKVGIVGRKLQRGIVAGGGLAVDASDPDGVEAELFDRGEGGVVEIGKFSATVLFEGTIGNASGVGVAEEARKELVDADFSTCAGNERGGGGRAFDGEREVMGEGAVTWAREKVGIGGAEELAPAVFGRNIFEGGDDLEFSLRGGPGAGDGDFDWGGFTREEFDFGG